MILPFRTHTPQIDETAFVAENATVIGQVRIGANASVWFGAVLRGDINSIEIGAGSNVQDNTVVHVNQSTPVYIGAQVTIGHTAIIHGCTIDDQTLIGMGATILDGVKIGKNCIIGAGALVTQNTIIPDGMLVFGSPAKVIRPVTEKDISEILRMSGDYSNLASIWRTTSGH